ncbi:MAG: glycosyltransferase family 4 protein [Opitutae bacterium]|nr:glycosyltransferase family 4 protein [Opitutae bacterium]
MHILFLSDNYPPEVNAPASRTFEHCREWVNGGDQVTIITGNPNFPKGKIFPGYRNRLVQKEKISGINVIRVWTYIAENKGFTKRTLDYLSFMVSSFIACFFVRKVDLIIGTSPQFFTAVSAWGCSLFKRAPFVFELRDLWPESIKAVGALKNSNFVRLFEALELFLYRRAFRIVSVTRSFKNNLVQRGINADKIIVVTNGVDLNRFFHRAKNEDLVKQLGLKDCFVAGYIGTHGMAHSLETLLYAMSKLRDHPCGKKIRLVLLGDGARKRFLKEEAKKLNLTNVIFIDTVSKEMVSDYWSILDTSIIHLKKTELFKTVIPSKLFECMGMGLPILHGVEGESADIVAEANCGVLFEPENVDQLIEKLMYLQSEPAFLLSLGRNALESAKKYERTHLARQMLDGLNLHKEDQNT